MNHLDMGLVLRNAVETDMIQLTGMLEDAIALLAKNNVDQWQNGTLSSELLLGAVLTKEAYVWEERDMGAIAGFCVINTTDDLYDQALSEGKWRVEGSYLAIHRVMVSQHIRGLKTSTQMFLDIKKMGIINGVQSLRVDTHPDNLLMQKALIRNGFVRTGLLYMPSGSPRYTYDFDLR